MVSRLLRARATACCLSNSHGSPASYLAGADHGNRSHIEKFIDPYALRAQIRFLGFVSAEGMRGIYEGCRAMVMPAYFGPKNLPLIEAWMMGRPPISSSHLQEEVGEAPFARTLTARENLCKQCRFPMSQRPVLFH